MTTKLTEAELAMMSQAAMRDDKCLSRPAKLSGARLLKTKEKLIEAGFVREVKGKGESPVWRRDDEGEVSYALELTAAGMKVAAKAEAAAAVTAAKPAPSNGRRLKVGFADVHRSTTTAVPPIAATVPPSAAAAQVPPETPRSGRKIAKVIELLRKESGAAISELIAATGWLPHTTRAALTGLRKRGYTVVLDRSRGERGSIYRIELEPKAAQPMPGNVAAEAP